MVALPYAYEQNPFTAKNIYKSQNHVSFYRKTKK